MQRMNAARFMAPGTLAMERVPLPEPGPSQVRIALEGTGVCASNLPLWQGAPWIKYPLQPGTGGHEGWGVIERTGSAVDPTLEGQHVAALSYHAYAEYDLAEADQVVLIPSTLVLRPFPGEALGCAVNIHRRSQIKAGQWVAIIGVGFLGALLTQLAVHAGAQVIAVSRRPHAVREGVRLGARIGLPLQARADVSAAVLELTGGQGCDRVIEATGKQEALDLATELVRQGGRLVIAGYHQDGPRVVNMQAWNWKGIDVINAHERDPAVSLAGMRAAVDLVGRGVLTPEEWYTEYPLEELGLALGAAAQRQGTFMKALVRTAEPLS